LFRVWTFPGEREEGVGEDQVEIVFEISGLSLRRAVRRGRRGFVESRSEGMMMPFACMRVCGVWTVGRRVIVDLVDATIGASLFGPTLSDRGASESRLFASREAERLVGELRYGGGGVEREGGVDGATPGVRAGELGHASAMLGVGRLFEPLQKTAGSAATAFGWYWKAAGQGHPDAMRRLGLCFARGMGVSGDKCAAPSWYRKAAKCECAIARVMLATRCGMGTACRLIRGRL
jgi:TPR repeat protein